LRFRVQGSGCKVQGLGSRVQGARFRVWGVGCRVQGVKGGAARRTRYTARFPFRVWGFGFRGNASGGIIQGLGFTVLGLRVFVGNLGSARGTRPASCL